MSFLRFWNIFLIFFIVLGVAILLWPKRRGVRIDEPIFSKEFLSAVKSIELKKGDKVLKLETVSAPVKLRVGKLETGLLLKYPELCAVSIEDATHLTAAFNMLAPRNKFQIPDDFKSEYEVILTASKERHLLRLGKEHPFSGRRYAVLDDSNEAILLDEAVLRPVLDAEYCERRILKFASELLAKIDIDGPKGKLSIRRDGKRWILSSGERADDFRVLQFLQQLSSLKAKGNIATGGSAEAGFKINLQFADGSQERFSAEKSGEDESVVRLEDPWSHSVWYLFDGKLIRILEITEDELKDRRIFRELALSDNPAREKLLQSIEVLSMESISGRVISNEKPRCEISGEGSKGERYRFILLGEIESMNNNGGSAPGKFVADFGSKHFQGVVSSDFAKTFCDEVNKAS